MRHSVFISRRCSVSISKNCCSSRCLHSWLRCNCLSTSDMNENIPQVCLADLCTEHWIHKVSAKFTKQEAGTVKCTNVGLTPQCCRSNGLLALGLCCQWAACAAVCAGVPPPPQGTAVGRRSCCRAAACPIGHRSGWLRKSLTCCAWWSGRSDQVDQILRAFLADEYDDLEAPAVHHGTKKVLSARLGFCTLPQVQREVLGIAKMPQQQEYTIRHWTYHKQ